MAESPEAEQPFKEPDREEDTLFEHTVTDRTGAELLFREISDARRATWVECASLQDFMHVEDRLKTLPEDSDVFLYVSMPSAYMSWDLVGLGFEQALGDALFRLWPEELRLYFVHAGKPLLE